LRYVVRVDDGAEVARIVRPQSIGSVSFSPDNALLALGTGQTSTLMRLSDGHVLFELDHASSAVFGADGRVLIAVDSKPNTLRLLDAHDGHTLTELPMPSSLPNRRAVIERDLARIVTWEVAQSPTHLLRALALTPKDRDSRFAISPDLAFVAKADTGIDITRTSDGEVLHLDSFDAITRVHVLYDDRGCFDGDPASLAHVRIRSADTGGEWVGSGPVFDAHRHAGLLTEFANGEQARAGSSIDAKRGRA
jgi:hypothetical protein